jgi:4-diphosphocytidyl-2-C-methyl-D-erythritol kinase
VSTGFFWYYLNVVFLGKHVFRLLTFNAPTGYSLLNKVSEEILKIRASAKINLHLAIKDRRPDGFHDLESIFLALDFGDDLRFALGEAEGRGFTALDTNWLVPGEAALPPEHNSVCKAAALFRERTGFARDLRVSLDKRIPLGAGLGGGSSDAAATLRALNTLSGAGLSAAALGDLAAQLGSDVPFFLKGGAAWVSGRGEHIQPLDTPDGLSVVLVYPGFVSNTAAAFRVLDDARNGATCGEDVSAARLIDALGEAPARWPYRNDFLPVFQNAGITVYEDTLADLRRLGADFCGLSGSGSTCFGIFSDATAAGAARESLLASAAGESVILLTFPLAYSIEGDIE